MTLDTVPLRTPVHIASVGMPVSDRRRLTELGLRHGAEVEVVRRGPFGGPLALRVARTGMLALRRDQAASILVAEVDGRG